MDFTHQPITNLSNNTSQSHAVFLESIQVLINSYSMTKSLFGPASKLILLGGNAMHLTSNLNLIYKTIPPSHPTSKVLLDYIQKMEDIGDCATFMVSLAAVLAKNVLSLVHKGMKKKNIEGVLRRIKKEIKVYEFQVYEEKMDTGESIERVIRGLVKNKELERVLREGIEIVKGEIDEDKIRVVKVQSGLVDESYTVRGMVLKGEPVSAKKEGKDLSTSIFNCPVEISRTVTKGTVLLETAADLLNFSKEEELGIKTMVDSLTKHNQVVFCNGKVENIFMDYFNEKGTIVFPLYSKHDIRRLRNSIGGCVSPVLREVMENGQAQEIKVFEEGNKKFTRVTNEEGGVATLVVKSSIQVVLDEYERVLNRAITFIIKNYSGECVRVVKGAGAFERELSVKLKEAMEHCEDSSRMVYKALSDSLIEVSVEREEEGVYDGFDAKMKAVQYAIELVSMVLNTENYFFVRVSDMNIKPRSNKNWDDD